jgi:hypothetical protein
MKMKRRFTTETQRHREEQKKRIIIFPVFMISLLFFSSLCLWVSGVNFLEFKDG